MAQAPNFDDVAHVVDAACVADAARVADAVVVAHFADQSFDRGVALYTRQKKQLPTNPVWGS